ncbi:MAG TPA: DNA recombination protein RmuC [Stellaceae bacterium]|nr:DNA recombination protein RmuC [Stellaceae bacterium]
MDLTLTIGIALAAAVAAAVVTAVLLRGREAASRAARIAAETQLQVALRDRDAAVEARVAAERGAAEARAEATLVQDRLGDFEKMRGEVMEAAKAAVTTTASQVSSKLLDDHKRELVAARDESEKRMRTVNESLVKQMEEVARIIHALDGRVEATDIQVDTLMRALSTPGGAGQLAEIGLANTLQSFGLELGRDFVLQATTVDEETGRRLRPDAIVFLPTGTVLVIDCKASKFILEIAELEGTPEEGDAYENLARTMNQHLKTLAERDYRNAVLAACRQAGRSGPDPHIISLMYLPNEGALEKLRIADAGFFQKARESQIIPAGPAGLHSALLIASAEIRRLRQMENQQEIVEKCRAMLESVGLVLSHAARAGSGLKSAVDNFAKMTASINGRLLPRARGLERLGIEPPKPLPGNLPNFMVQTAEETALIEAEAAEVEPELPRLLAE